jgi:hypothetical protein
MMVYFVWICVVILKCIVGLVTNNESHTLSDKFKVFMPLNVLP